MTGEKLRLYQLHAPSLAGSLTLALKTDQAQEIRKTLFCIRRESIIIKIIFQSLQFIAIIGAAAVAFIINIPEISKITPTIISGIVTISATLTKYYKFKEKGNYATLCYRKLKREYDLYSNSLGKYADLDSGEALDILLENIHNLKQEIEEEGEALDKKLGLQMADYNADNDLKVP